MKRLERNRMRETAAIDFSILSVSAEPRTVCTAETHSCAYMPLKNVYKYIYNLTDGPRNCSNLLCTPHFQKYIE